MRQFMWFHVPLRRSGEPGIRVTAIAPVATLTAAVVLATMGPAAAACRHAPGMHFTPPRYGYGKVLAGRTASHEFTLYNTARKSTGRLRFNLSGPAAFTLTAKTCRDSLGPFKSCRLSVRFAPAAAGLVTATLTAVGATGGIARVALTGNGTEPGHIYWTNSLTGSMEEANLDGSDPHTIITVPGVGVSGVAVNKTNLYWGTDGSIGVANLDGGDPRTIITGLNSSYALAVGRTHLYWTEFGGLDHGPGIWEANLNGSNPRPIIDSGLGCPDAVAVSSTHLYWADGCQDVITVANLDGSDPHTLIAGQWGSYGVAVSNTHVYWVNGPYSIAEAGLDGTDPHTLITDQNGPFAIAIGGTHLYWTHLYSSFTSIAEANLDGTDQHQIFTGQYASDEVAVSVP